jgi:acyl carrier protein
VFPDLDPQDIPNASQASVPAWDSVATITLLNVIDDEFGVLLDFERIEEFNSFTSIENYLAAQRSGS